MAAVQAVTRTYIELAPFTSFFEATFALNLAFSLISQVHDNAYNKYCKMKDAVLGRWKSEHFEPGSDAAYEDEHENIINEWHSEESRHKVRSEGILRFARPWAKVSAMLSLIILCIVGYYPTFYVETETACWVVILTSAPTILTFICLQCYWRIWVTYCFRSKVDIQDRAYAIVERMVKSQKTKR